ncbi:MAG TPA: LuxR C-terminal-related transcriptional regulator [Ktedonobacterales bacterium]|jgi:non-specific serine/threonine protein kinase
MADDTSDCGAYDGITPGTYDLGWREGSMAMASQTQEWLPQASGLSRRAAEILRLLAEGLSDREIAERLVMTINTVKWYNRQIYRTLGVSSRTQAIARARQAQLLDEEQGATPALRIVPHTPTHHLPVETTHFIGRTHELAAIKRLLYLARLLTLVGPPGTGKTRLARQVAWEVADSFREGAHFVPLAPISDPALVPRAIANVLGIRDTPNQPLMATLQQALRERHLLLILDNFEHVLAAASCVSDLLAAAPHLKVLTTSREPLHLYGEQEYEVPPLELPVMSLMEHPDPQALTVCESTALFLQAAQAVRPDFQVSAENAVDIANICLRLDGLPLAIELAAARIKLLPPRALLARLNRRLETLTGGPSDLLARQQTLQNTIAWSYNLLNADEKMLLARLAVFLGGCSLEAVEAVCGDERQKNVLYTLSALVDKSLIQQRESSGGDPRFVMLETIRDYARERLGESGGADIMSRRHAEYFVELAEHAEPELRLAQQWQWFHRLETDYANLRAVLRWSLDEGDCVLGVRLAGALGLFWDACGYHAEGRQWSDRLLERLDAVPMIYHTKLLIAAGHMALRYDPDTAQSCFDRALQISREVGDPINTAWALTFKGFAILRDTEPALALARAGLSAFRELHHKPGIAQALNIIGLIANVAGDTALARQVYEECLAVSQETGESRRIRFMLINLTFLALHTGEYERARDLAMQGLRLALEMNNKLDIADSLAGLAGVMGVTGQPQHAARLLGAWEAAFEWMGATALPSAKREHDRSIAAVSAQLDDTAFKAAWAKGRAMSLKQAVEFALQEGDL